MDYEELYQILQTTEKSFKEKLIILSKGLKSISANSEKGYLKVVSKELSSLEGVIKDCDALLSEYIRHVDAFDASAYMSGGDFAQQLLQNCREFDIDVNGDYPVYDIFPYKVKIDAENQEVYIDRKKLQCVRPVYLTRVLKNSQDKLNRSSFNVLGFLNELAVAYDIACINKKKQHKVEREYDISLRELYNYLVPMQRSRREYDLQSYAFDLSRLYGSGIEQTKDGRAFQLGQNRNAAKLIRILDRDGKEQYLSTIIFFKR